MKRLLLLLICTISFSISADSVQSKLARDAAIAERMAELAL